MCKAGDTYGRLTLLRQVGREKCGNARWLVRCACGVEFEAALNNVTSGRTRSCGCLKVEKLKDRYRSYMCY